MAGNRLEHNDIGLFWCWGVKYGSAEQNKIVDNRSYGISVGHNDTDNVMRDNEITGSGKIGVLFRDEGGGKNFWANRNVLERNRIINSGGPDGVAIEIQGQTSDLRIVGNELREMREPANRTGVRIAAGAGRIELADNRIDGFSVAVRDERHAASPR